jgi:hypothetical protein
LEWANLRPVLYIPAPPARSYIKILRARDTACACACCACAAGSVVLSRRPASGARALGVWCPGVRAVTGMRSCQPGELCTLARGGGSRCDRETCEKTRYIDTYRKRMGSQTEATPESEAELWTFTAVWSCATAWWQRAYMEATRTRSAFKRAVAESGSIPAWCITKGCAMISCRPRPQSVMRQSLQTRK